MKELNHNKENMYTFLANVQGVTKRAVKSLETENPAKFQRDAIGALFQSLGFSFQDIYDAFLQYPSALNIQDNIKKIQVLEGLSSVLGSSTETNSVRVDNNFKIAFLKEYFKNFTSKRFGMLRFSVENKLKYGTKVAEVLSVKAIDITSTIDNPCDEIDILISPYGNGDNVKSTDEIIKIIKEHFNDFYEAEDTKMIPLKQTLKISDTLNSDTNQLLQLSYTLREKANEKFLKSHTVEYGDTVSIVDSELIDGVEYVNTSISIKGMKYEAKLDAGYFEEIMGLYWFYSQVIDAENITNNEYVFQNVDCILELVKEREEAIKELSKEDDEEILDNITSSIFGYVLNLETIILEHFEPGLSKAMREAINSVEYSHHPTHAIKQSTLNRKWTRVDETTYSRDKEFKALI